MNDYRKKNGNWKLNPNPDGTYPANDARLAVLMDVRDELRSLNGLLGCTNFINIPKKLDAIRRNTAPKKPKKKATAK